MYARCLLSFLAVLASAVHGERCTKEIYDIGWSKICPHKNTFSLYLTPKTNGESSLLDIFQNIDLEQEFDYDSYFLILQEAITDCLTNNSSICKTSVPKEIHQIIYYLSDDSGSVTVYRVHMEEKKKIRTQGNVGKLTIIMILTITDEQNNKEIVRRSSAGRINTTQSSITGTTDNTMFYR